MIKQLMMVVAMVALPILGTACNQPTGNISCNVTSTTTLSCNYNGISVSVPIPADIAAVLGLVTITVPTTSLNGVSAPANLTSFTAHIDAKNKLVYITNNSSGKTVAYPVPKTGTVVTQ